MATPDGLSLESVRNSLIRQEDTIIFSLIERSRYPLNALLYEDRCSLVPGISCSLLECIFKQTEAAQAKFGRYQSPEEHPFFPDDLPHSLVPPQKCSGVLHPAAASININRKIWDMYINQLLPSFASKGHSENYACIAASDLECLQALSRRIHYGKLVAEVKFRDASEDYTQAIRVQDRDALMKLLTVENVEKMVKKRVEKKAKVFGQEVCLTENEYHGNYKIDPSIVSRLYDEWGHKKLGLSQMIIQFPRLLASRIEKSHISFFLIPLAVRILTKFYDAIILIFWCHFYIMTDFYLQT